MFTYVVKILYNNSILHWNNSLRILSKYKINFKLGFIRGQISLKQFIQNEIRSNIAI